MPKKQREFDGPGGNVRNGRSKFFHGYSIAMVCQVMQKKKPRLSRNISAQISIVCFPTCWLIAEYVELYETDPHEFVSRQVSFVVIYEVIAVETNTNL